MTGSGADEPEAVGTIAEEAFRLFRAVAAGGDSSGGETGGETTEHVCTATWCPVCQVVGFVRQNPEALTAVTHSAVAFAQSLRDLVDVALAPQEEQ